MLRIRPDPVPALPGRASPDVFLQDPGVLSLLLCQAFGGVGRVGAAENKVFRTLKFVHFLRFLAAINILGKASRGKGENGGKERRGMMAPSADYR